jgi:hypothetical protein
MWCDYGSGIVISIRTTILVACVSLAPTIGVCDSLRVPDRSIPDSLVLEQGGCVDLYFHVDAQDSIVSWELGAISVYDTCRSQFKHVYRNPIRFLTWSDKMNKYVAGKSLSSTRTRLPLGTLLANRLRTWLRRFANETRFEGSPGKEQPLGTSSEHRDIRLYHHQLDFGIGKMERWISERRRWNTTTIGDTVETPGVK